MHRNRRFKCPSPPSARASTLDRQVAGFFFLKKSYRLVCSLDITHITARCFQELNAFLSPLENPVKKCLRWPEMWATLYIFRSIIEYNNFCFCMLSERLSVNLITWQKTGLLGKGWKLGLIPELACWKDKKKKKRLPLKLDFAACLFFVQMYWYILIFPLKFCFVFQLNYFITTSLFVYYTAVLCRILHCLFPFCNDWIASNVT